MEIKVLFEEHGIECDTKLIVSANPVHEEIISIARKSKVGQIFIMSQEEPHVKDMFLGSTAREVVKISEVPVLSVTPNIQTTIDPLKSLYEKINKPISRLQVY